jgi:hypothetical protein
MSWLVLRQAIRRPSALDVYCNRNRKWQVDNNATDKPKVHDLAWKSRRHEIIESLIKPDYITLKRHSFYTF